jgi:hypothetical protein
VRARPPDPRSGIQPDGSFVPAFEGQREPVTPGNAASVTHGAYTALRLKPRAAEIAQLLRESCPVREDRLTMIAETAGMVGSRFELAIEALLARRIRPRSRSLTYRRIAVRISHF